MTDPVQVHLAQAGSSRTAQMQQATQLARGQLESALFRGISGHVIIENGTFVSDHRIIIPSPSSDVPYADDFPTTLNRNMEANIPRRHQDSIPTSTTRVSHEIYLEELFKRKRGSPLWVPGPSSELPKAYRRNGVGIGDVGIINVDLPFDFLFNIFHSGDHAINARGVPDSFRRLDRGDVDEFQCDGEGGYLGSSSLRQRRFGSESSSLQFEMTASDSAILVMPKGAYRKAVKSIRNMRDYMTPSTIESWYKYAVEVRGRDLQNGDIRLVYACDKAPSWGIATVSGTNGRPVSLTFKEVKDQGTYEWEYNGTADIARRVGPCRDENRDLDGVVDNQCLFLRTLNAQFSDQRWKEIEIELELSLASRMKKFAVRNGNNGLVPHPASILNRFFLGHAQCTDEMIITTDDDWISLMDQSGLLENQLPQEPIPTGDPSSSVLTVGDLAAGTVAVMQRDSDGNLDRAARDGKRPKGSGDVVPNLRPADRTRAKNEVITSNQLAINHRQGFFSITRSITGFFSPFPFSEAEKAVKAATNALRDYRKSQQGQYLTTAIAQYRRAYETSNEKHIHFPDIINNYAALLNKQDRLLGIKSSLEEVIRLLEEARVVMEKRTRPTANYGILLNNLGQAYLDRCRVSKTGQDLQSAMDTFNRARSQNGSFPVSLVYACSLIGSATTLLTACELELPAATDVKKLHSAITFLKTAQKQRDIEIQVECYRQLASAYDLLYKKTTNRDNLDLSIGHYAQALDRLHHQYRNLVPTLLSLAKQHFERHKLTKAPNDLITAQKHRDEAKALVDQVPGANELKRQIEDLTSNMAPYDERGQAYKSVVSLLDAQKCIDESEILLPNAEEVKTQIGTSTSNTELHAMHELSYETFFTAYCEDDLDNRQEVLES